MGEINLVKIDKLLEINRTKPTTFKQFSAICIFPPAVKSFGFDPRHFRINWFTVLKFINASKEDLIIEDISAECIGEGEFKWKSIGFSTNIYRTTKDNELDILEELLLIGERKMESKKEQFLFFPYLFKSHSLDIILVKFILVPYKRICFNYYKPLKPNEISKNLEMLKESIVKIKTDRSSKPLLIKL